MDTNHYIDLKNTIKLVLQKGWIILLLILVFVGGARYVSTYFIDKVYEAQTTMFIGKEKGSVNIGLSLSDLQTYNQLIIDYKEIANSRLVILSTINNLNMNIDIEDFRKALSIDIVEGSRLFTVSFSSKDPVLSAKVANELAVQLSLAVAEIVDVENIRVIDEALAPNNPSSPNVNMITLLAGVLGLMLGLLVVYLMETFNDTFSDVENVENSLGLDVMAVIPKFTKEQKNSKNKLITTSNPNSYLAESYKMCRTNLNYMDLKNKQKVIMLTSSIASEGKTTTSCNLAVSMAQEKKKVLLIDADLRKSIIYKMFNISKMPGLTEAIYNQQPLSTLIQHVEDIPGLDILVAGKETSIPTELLGSDMFEKILNEARQSYDTIIIDAPPILNVADTVILSKVSDKVLFIIKMNKTKKEMVMAAKKSLEKVGVNMMGMVLTNVQVKNQHYYYYLDSEKKGKRRK